MTTTAGAPTPTPGEDPRPPDAAPPRWLTVPEVAAELRVANMTVYRLCTSGELPSVRVGRSVRIRATDFDTYLEAAVTTPDH